MPLQPLRFLHAANLLLDCQLDQDAPLPDDLRTLVQDATLTALGRLIDAAIERKVDFLLLTGNTFDVRQRSVRARVALHDGLRRLDEHQIRAFIVPGETDPAWAWSDLPTLPGNITLLNDLGDEPIAVLRDGRVIATIRGCPAATSHLRQNATEANRRDTSRREPFSIGVTVMSADADEEDDLSDQVDYLALGGAARQRTTGAQNGPAHHPGGTQPLTSDDVGPHGATLVSVGEQGTVQQTFVPTAAVRWESLTAVFDPHTTLQELAGSMRAELERIHPEPGEDLWLVDWLLQGAGELYEKLQNDPAPLAELLGDAAPVATEIRCRHTWNFVPRVDPAAAGTRGGRMAGEFFELLDTELPLSSPSLVDGLADVPLPPAMQRRLRHLVAEMDPELVAGEARRLGKAWFEAELTDHTP